MEIVIRKRLYAKCFFIIFEYFLFFSFVFILLIVNLNFTFFYFENITYLIFALGVDLAKNKHKNLHILHLHKMEWKLQNLLHKNGEESEHLAGKFVTTCWAVMLKHFRMF